MVWKKKEKPLTLEQTIALARKDLSRFWMNSPPLIGGVSIDGKASVHPLDPEFGKHPWVIAFVDPFSFAGDSCLPYLREWNARYAMNNVSVLAFLKLPYESLREAEHLQSWLKRHQIAFPCAVDADGFLAAAFKADPMPRVLLFDRGTFVIERSGEGWLAETELAIQNFLRSHDAGLPLFPPYLPQAKLPRDKERIDPQNPLLKYHGTWTRQGEALVTNDPAATIRFKSPGGRVSIVAKATTGLEAAKIFVEVNDAPVYEELSGQHLSMDEDGGPSARVDSIQLYHLLAKLPPSERNVTLNFTSADRSGVAIYGICFGD